MPFFAERLKVFITLSVVLVLGFFSVICASYWVSRNAVLNEIASQTLPQTGDSVYSEIQKDLLRPVFISSQMAHDTFLRDWMLAGELDQAQVVRYLKEVKEKYGAVSSFLVSDKTHHYYYPQGILKTVQEGDARDAWYFRARALSVDYETNVDADMANNDTVTVFINHQVKDYSDKVIGVTGVGLTLGKVAQDLQQYQNRFGRRVFFVDQAGMIVLSAQQLPDSERAIRQNPGIQAIADQILASGTESTQLQYRRGTTTVLLNSRYIPELSWYLVVEQDDTEGMRQVRRVLWVNVAIGCLVTALVLFLALMTVKRYQKTMENAASHDALTGLFNRHTLDLIFSQLLRDADRYKKPLSAILFDIDLFKKINDQYGHLKGDEVLRTVAELVSQTARNNDVLVRWGGDEFLLLLKDCPREEAVTVAEKIRKVVSTHMFSFKGKDEFITLSISVAQHHANETDTRFFARLDESLYLAKSNGRNKIIISA